MARPDHQAVRLASVTLAIAAISVAAPARAAVCPAEASLHADPHWRDTGCHECVVNRVYVGPGRLLHWNGVTRDLTAIRQYLTIIRTLTPEPYTELVIRPGADCGAIAAIRQTIERTLPCDRLGCGYALVRDLPRPRHRMPNPR